MTPKEMRIAICSVMPGWTAVGGGTCCIRTDPDARREKGGIFDPLEDLNAAHEMECSLTVDEISIFLAELEKVTKKNSVYSPSDIAFWFAHATAAQRAEAFLKTKGLWK